MSSQETDIEHSASQAPLKRPPTPPNSSERKSKRQGPEPTLLPQNFKNNSFKDSLEDISITGLWDQSSSLLCGQQSSGIVGTSKISTSESESVASSHKQISTIVDGPVISAEESFEPLIVDSEEVEILYQAPIEIDNTSQLTVEAIEDELPRSRPQSAMALEPEETTSSDAKNFTLLPQSFMNKVTRCLHFRCLCQCRQVCRNWNQQISSSPVFLNKSVFIMGPNLDLVQLCKKTQVKWRNIKCQLLPCPEFYSTRSYQQKFIVTKLIQGPKTFFTSGIDSIILDHVEIQKENLLKWLSSCGRLTKIEFQSCTFKKTKVSWTDDTLFKIAERLRVIKVKEMALSSLVDVGKLILVFTRKLKLLELSQNGLDSSQSEVTAMRVKTLEEDMTSILNIVLEKNVKALRSLELSLEAFRTDGLLAKAFHKIGRTGLNLDHLGFEIRPSKSKFPLLNVTPQTIDVVGSLKQLFKTSKNLQSLHVPFLLLDFSDMRDICWDLPSTLKEIGLQICTPMMDNVKKFDIGSKLSINKMAIYGKIFQDLEWLDFHKCVPWVTEIQLLSEGLTNSDVQGVIQNLPLLKAATFDRVVGMTDLAITGVEPKVFKRVSEMLASKGADGLSCLNFRHNNGIPLQSMKNLRSFICRGDMVITDVGIGNGLCLPELEHLEISGSNLQVTERGLMRLASFCPKLTSLTLQLNRTLVTLEKVKTFTSLLKFLHARSTKIDF